MSRDSDPLDIENYNRAEALLRSIGIVPADLVRGKADSRWPMMAETIAIVEEALNSAEYRGFCKGWRARPREGCE